MEPRVVVDHPYRLGENPLWHPVEQRLYWTDITGQAVYRLGASGAPETVFEGETVGGFTFQADGSLLLFMAHGKIAVLGADGSLRAVHESLPDEAEARFNDVIADPEGRVFCGTMPFERGPRGALYRLDLDGSIVKLVEGITISNGLGFTPALDGLYYIDTPTQRIDLFDYDRATGAIANRRLFADTTGDDGDPDGMTVDADGYVWCARWNGWSCIRYAPDGRPVQRIDFPARKVSSVVFGGADCATMYFTTAGRPTDAEEDNGAAGGRVFALDAGVAGRPEFLSRILL